MSLIRKIFSVTDSAFWLSSSVLRSCFQLSRSGKKFRRQKVDDSQLNDKNRDADHNSLFGKKDGEGAFTAGSAAWADD